MIEYFRDEKFITVQNGETNLIDLSLKKIHKEELKGHYIPLEKNTYLVKINGKQGVLKLGKEWILPPKYKEIIYVEPGVYLVSDGRQSYFFKNGKLVKTDRAYTGKEIVFVRYA